MAPWSALRWTNPVGTVVPGQVLGPWVVQDGVMGPNTGMAIRRFQEQRQLRVTSVLDEPTVNALHAACGR